MSTQVEANHKENLKTKAPPSILGNFGLSTASSFLAKGMRFVFASILLSTMGAAAWGEITFSLTVISYLIFVLDFGVSTFSSLHKTESVDLDRHFFANLVYVRFVVFCILCLAAWFMLPLLEIEGGNTLKLYSLLLLIRPFSLEWLYIRKGYHGLSQFIQMIRQGILFLAVICGWVQTIEALVLVDIFSEVIAVGLLLFFGKKYAIVHRGLFKPKSPWILYRESFPLFFSALFVMMHMNVDILVIRSLLGLEQTGIYDYSYRLMLFVFMLGAGLSIPLRRQLSLLHSKEEEAIARKLIMVSRKTLLLLAVAFQLFAVYGAPLFFELILNENSNQAGVQIQAVEILKVLSIYLGVSFVSIPLAEWFMTRKNRRVYVTMTILAGSLNLGLNLLFIPRWGINGAAWATVCAEIVILIFLTVQKHAYHVSDIMDLLKAAWPYVLQGAFFVGVGLFVDGIPAFFIHSTLLGVVLLSFKFLQRSDLQSLMKTTEGNSK